MPGALCARHVIERLRMKLKCRQSTELFFKIKSLRKVSLTPLESILSSLKIPAISTLQAVLELDERFLLIAYVL